MSREKEIDHRTKASVFKNSIIKEIQKQQNKLYRT